MKQPAGPCGHVWLVVILTLQLIKGDFELFCGKLCAEGDDLRSRAVQRPMPVGADVGRFRVAKPHSGAEAVVTPNEPA